MAEQKQIQKKIRFVLSSQTSKENLSFVILLMLMSLVRTRLKLALPKPGTNFLKRSFSHRAAKSWNEWANSAIGPLSNEITDDFRQRSVSAFKRRLEKNN